MGWKDHEESGEEVRSIRDWDFMKGKYRDDGATEIIYGNSGGDSADHTQHGHYVEDSDGNEVYNRPPK